MSIAVPLIIGCLRLAAHSVERRYWGYIHAQRTVEHSSTQVDSATIPHPANVRVHRCRTLIHQCDTIMSGLLLIAGLGPVCLYDLADRRHDLVSSSECTRYICDAVGGGV